MKRDEPRRARDHEIMTLYEVAEYLRLHASRRTGWSSAATFRPFVAELSGGFGVKRSTGGLRTFRWRQSSPSRGQGADRSDIDGPGGGRANCSG
jgi:hypothetical protein